MIKKPFSSSFKAVSDDFFFDNEIFEYILLFKCMEATGIFVSKNGCFSLVVFIAFFFFQILSSFSLCSMFSGKIYLSATVYIVHGILQ